LLASGPTTAVVGLAAFVGLRANDCRCWSSDQQLFIYDLAEFMTCALPLFNGCLHVCAIVGLRATTAGLLTNNYF